MFDARAVARSYQFDLSVVLEWESMIIELSGHYGAGGDYSLTAIVEKLTTAHILEIYTHLTTQSITINLSLCIRVTVARVTHQVTSSSPPPPPRRLSAAFGPIARPSTGHQRHSAGHAMGRDPPGSRPIRCYTFTLQRCFGLRCQSVQRSKGAISAY
jgi:hypothetical protein